MELTPEQIEFLENKYEPKTIQEPVTHPRASFIQNIFDQNKQIKQQDEEFNSILKNHGYTDDDILNIKDTQKLLSKSMDKLSGDLSNDYSKKLFLKLKYEPEILLPAAINNKDTINYIQSLPDDNSKWRFFVDTLSGGITKPKWYADPIEMGSYAIGGGIPVLTKKLVEKGSQVLS